MQVVSTTEAVRGKTGHIPQGQAYWGSAERHDDLETTEERRGEASAASGTAVPLQWDPPRAPLSSLEKLLSS